MIEAAIVGRPVHTILGPDFEPTQRGTFHFDYLLEVGGGLLVVGHTPEEHRDQLAASLRGDDPQAPSRTAFLESFVRPHGLDRPALPTLLDTIEEVAELPPAAVRVDGPVVLATRAFLRAVLISWHATRRFRVGAE
jgi:hypothetical protein